jgi:hypothetical protein
MSRDRVWVSNLVKDGHNRLRSIMHAANTHKAISQIIFSYLIVISHEMRKP